MIDAVRDYYAGFAAREWGRLLRPEDGALEFLTTTQLLDQHLAPQSRVLDLGGGPGRYSLWLAERGHRVSLADLSPELLAIARDQVAASPAAERIAEIVEADARDLARWSDASFDAVLALGPFYHLTAPADREAAAAELARVLVPGGLAFIALMPRFAFLRRVLANPLEQHLLAQPGFVSRVLDEGIFRNDRPGAFTEGYGVTVPEVEPFFARFDLLSRGLFSAESLAPDLQAALAALGERDPAAYRAALAVLLRTAAEPSILGMASHLLYVCQRAPR